VPPWSRRHSLAALALALATASCSSTQDHSAHSGDSGDTESSGAGDGNLPTTSEVDLRADTHPVIAVEGNHFRPSHVVVRSGAEVAFRGDAGHDVVFTDGVTEQITREDFARQGEWVRRFDAPGEHPFHCSWHGVPGKGMYGVVRVED
jgi:plastocyanin